MIKKVRSMLLTTALALTMVSTTWGFFGSDDFSGPAGTMGDSGFWGKGDTHENVTFDLDGAGNLVYSTGSGGSEYEGRWHLNQFGSYTQPWTVELEVGTVLTGLDDDTRAYLALNLGVMDSAGWGHFGVEMGLEVFRYEGDDYRGVFFEGWAKDGDGEDDEVFVFQDLTDDQVRLSLAFDPVLNRLTAGYTLQGEPIVEFHEYDLSFWQDVLGDGFHLMLKADSENVAIAPGGFYATEFYAIPEPGTLSLVGLGLLGYAIVRRRRRVAR